MTMNVPAPCRHELHRQPPVHRSPCRFVGAPIAVGFCILLIAGCAKNPAKPQPPAVNSDAPNANARIVSQQIFGDTGQKSEFFRLKSADGVSEWFVGRLNGSGVVGRLSAAGDLVWHSPLAFAPHDLEALSSSSSAPSGAIAVGSLDVNDDGQSEVGYATLVTPAGGIVNQQLYASDSSDVWLNSIAVLSDSLFVVAGGERTTSRTNPFVALLALTAAGTLEKRQHIVVSSISGRYAWCVATDPGDALASTRRIYLSADTPTGTNTTTLHGIDVAAATLAPWSVA